MPTWNSRGLRGSAFENLINQTNLYYDENGLALVQKIPTPITPIKISPDSSQITLAYFENKSTVDYLGVVQGIPICFDAKEFTKTSFPLANIHAHQYEFMKKMEEQEGISFLLFLFTKINKCYYMRFVELEKFWNRREKKERKSFKIEELSDEFFFNIKGTHIPYLNMIQKDLDYRKK